ncbi:MAG: histidine kinase [Saprospiraceae bacterium]|nr:histidine kinase [Saprospiraceae bacterium]
MKFICVILLVFQLSYLKAQPIREIEFRPFGIELGFTGQYPYCVYKDNRGLLWIAAENGLYRYDGKNFKVYNKLVSNTNPFHTGFNYQICEDPDGNLWITNQNGISFFNIKSESFFNYTSPELNYLSNEKIHFLTMELDSYGTPWICTAIGLYYIDKKNKQILKSDSFSKKEIKNARFLKVSKDGLVVITNFKSLFINTATKVVASKDNLIIGEPYSVNQDICGNFQISTDRGLYHTKFNGLTFGKMNSNVFLKNLNSWFPDNNQSYFVSWDMNRAKIALIESGDTSLYYPEYKTDENDSLFQRSMFRNLYVDKHQILWLVTLMGIYYSDGHPAICKNYLMKDRDTLFRHIQGILKDNSHYWLSHDATNSFYEVDENFHVLRKISTKTGVNPLTTANPRKFYKDTDGSLWISTTNGLFHWNKNILSRYLPEPENPLGSINFNSLRDILPYGKDKLWIITARGLVLFDKNNKRFKKYKQNEQDQHSLFESRINALNVDHKGTLWIGSISGLMYYDSLTDHFNRIKLVDSQDLKNTANLNDIKSISKGSHSDLWLTSGRGLVCYNMDTRSYKMYNSIEDYTVNLAMKLAFDELGNLWFNNLDGLCAYDTSQRKIRIFTKVNGLPLKIVENVIYANNGSVIVTDVNHVSVLNVKEALSSNDEFKTNIYQVKSGDSLVLWNENENGIKSIHTSYKLRDFKIYFLNDGYFRFNNIRYFYKLEGSQLSWQPLSENFVELFNLRSGHYLISVASGVSKDKIVNWDQISIVIDPIWYSSNWFQLFLLVFISVGIMMIYRLRLKTLQRNAQYKHQMAETKLEAMRAQMNPHFIFNCLNSIDNFILKNDPLKASEYLGKFSKLIRAILNNSKQSLVPLSQELETLKIYLQLEQLRMNNAFSFEIDVDQLLINHDPDIPPMLMQPYVENAIIHGLRNKEKGKGWIKIKLEQIGFDKVLYKVEDNGVGRRQAGLLKSKNEKTHKSFGTEITQNRLDLYNQKYAMNSSVTITDLYDERGKPTGTRVEVIIPL